MPTFTSREWTQDPLLVFRAERWRDPRDIYRKLLFIELPSFYTVFGHLYTGYFGFISQHGEQLQCQFDDHVWRWVCWRWLWKRIPVATVTVWLWIHAGESSIPLRTPSADGRESPTKDEVHHQRSQGTRKSLWAMQKVLMIVLDFKVMSFHRSCW